VYKLQFLTFTFTVLLHFLVISAKLPFWTALPSQIIRPNQN